MAFKRTIPNRTQAYLGTSIALRFVWIGLAIASLAIHALEPAAFASEFLVMLFLTYESHPHLLKGLDPEPDGGTNVFLANTGIQVLVTGAVLFYFIPLSQFFPLHLPHVIGDPLHHLIPSQNWALAFISLQMLALAPVFGFYLYLVEPDGAALLRVGRSLHGTRDPEDTREEERIFRADDRTPSQWGAFLVIVNVIGFTTAFATMLFALVFTTLFLVPKLLVAIILIWLAHDVLQHQFDLEAGVGHMLAEVGEEIERPKRWFVELEMVESGMKGIMVTMFVVLGIGLSGVMGTLAATFGFGSVQMFVTAVERLPAVVGPDVLKQVSDPFWTLELIYTFLLIPVIGALFPLIAVANGLTWYVFLERLPHWTENYEYDTATHPAETRPVPRGALAAYLLSWAVFPVMTLGIDVSDTVVAAGFDWGPYLLFGGLVCFEVGMFVAIRRAFASLARRRIGPDALDRDNYRILGVVLVPFLAMVAFETYTVAMMVGVVALIILVYFMPDLELFVDEHVESKIHRTALLQGYMVIGLGIITFLLDFLDFGGGPPVIEYAIWFVVGGLALHWILVLKPD